MSAEIIVTTKEELEALLRETVKEELTEALAKVDLSKPAAQAWLSVKQKANQQNISVSMVYKLLAQGKLETKTIGRKRLIKA